MRIAFYAPLKSPDDRVPSGDRLIARMLVAALERAGHHVEIASRLRSFDRDGDSLHLLPSDTFAEYPSGRYSPFSRTGEGGAERRMRGQLPEVEEAVSPASSAANTVPPHPPPSCLRLRAGGHLLPAGEGKDTAADLRWSGGKRWRHRVEVHEDWASDAGVRGAVPSRQQRLHVLGERIAKRLIRRWSMLPPSLRPRLWFTYHLYHKAPDWIGPVVARAFGIPYVVAEASVTPRQATGPWAYGHRGVLAALAQADLVIGLNPKDRAAVDAVRPPGAASLALAPFIDTAPFIAAAHQREALRQHLAHTHAINPEVPWLVSVAMMRADAKRDSYRLLAQALQPLAETPWHLLVVGDGAAGDAVRAFFSPVTSRVTFLGALPADKIVEVLAAGDLFVWPALNEAIGMVFLEAQAAGLPVIGANRPGVASVVADGQSGLLVAEGDVAAFSAAIHALVIDPERCRAMGHVAQSTMRRDHDLVPASQRLARALEDLTA